LLLIRQEIADAAAGRPSAVTLGVFDGVHRGHVHLINQTRQAAADLGCASGVITLYPSPEAILHPRQPVSYLTSLEERLELIRDTGVDWVARVTFTSELAQLAAHDVVDIFCQEAKMCCLVEGPGFALGRQREGDLAYLAARGAELGFQVREAVPLVEGGAVISSTLVRESLDHGKMEFVSELLGRPFSLRGPVVLGAERGRTIGFPTANIAVAPDRLLPPFGVYVTRSLVGEQAYPSVTNIGLRPTFQAEAPTVEAHLLDFDGDLYDREMRLEILRRIRPEQKFADVDELKAQIARDVETARQFHSMTPN
jgi:riboflavin kinase / FMN adenylyltransferase